MPPIRQESNPFICHPRTKVLRTKYRRNNPAPIEHEPLFLFIKIDVPNYMGHHWNSATDVLHHLITNRNIRKKIRHLITTSLPSPWPVFLFHPLLRKGYIIIEQEWSDQQLVQELQKELSDVTKQGK